jgi:polar amino acid transport system substrate-binding protein
LYDVVINGIVPDEARGQAVLLSNPYYAGRLVLLTRSDGGRVKSILDCAGASVGVVQSSKAGIVLENNLKDVRVVRYPNEFRGLADLKNGRIDAVLFDGQIANYYVQHLPGFKVVDTVGEITYSIVVATGNGALMDKINGALATMKADGSLDAIIAKWGIGNDNYRKMIAGDGQVDGKSNATTVDSETAAARGTKSWSRYGKLLPFFGRAACTTLLISVFAMGVAVFLGLGLAIAIMYMPRWMGCIARSIIEFLRGTPLLIQLFFVFYGLPYVGLTLSPMVAGILTLGINYSSYEAENFRAGMLAVPYGQTEAARALGMSHWQTLRHVILPQAFSFILPPLTNDFISLIKDSSLVSIITIVELTEAYTIVSNNSYDFFGTGIVVAVIYFLLGIPFVRLARWAENHLRLEKRAYYSKKIGR